MLEIGVRRIQPVKCASDRALVRREIRSTLERSAEHARRLVALGPALAHRLYGREPEPGIRFLGVPMKIDPGLGPFGWEVRLYRGSDKGSLATEFAGAVL